MTAAWSTQRIDLSSIQ